jgi:16S rRNA G966 N2-methylase RsmD
VLQYAIDGDPFDVVVLDPPYEHELLDAAIDAAAQHLATDGRLVVEHASRRALPAVASARPVRTLRSGDSALTIFERHTTAASNAATRDS